jgi:hypothetical protein
MEYAFIGFLVPAKDNNDANNIICNISNAVFDYSECNLREAYTIAGIPVLDDIAKFGVGLEQFLKQYNIEMES